MNKDERRKLLDSKQKDNLKAEIDWLWEQYQDSAFPQNPDMSFRKFCDGYGYELLDYRRSRKDGYGDPLY